MKNRKTCVKQNSWPLSLIDFDICINCIKGEETNKNKLEANKILDILEVIHMDIYRSFPMTAWNGQQYFMTFIDNFLDITIDIFSMRSHSPWICS